MNEVAGEMGFASLRDKQKEAILGFMKGRDVFVSLPTGSGKSLCYSILPKVFDRARKKKSSSIVIVVSPLIALMKDQVQSLATKGVKAVLVTKDTAKECAGSSTVEQLHEGTFQVVLFSPEALLCDDDWREMIQSSIYQENVVAFVIDEAHLVKKWYVY